MEWARDGMDMYLLHSMSGSHKSDRRGTDMQYVCVLCCCMCIAYVSTHNTRAKSACVVVFGWLFGGLFGSIDGRFQYFVSAHVKMVRREKCYTNTRRFLPGDSERGAAVWSLAVCYWFCAQCANVNILQFCRGPHEPRGDWLQDYT